MNNISDILMDIDRERKTGKITPFEFRSSMRKLNMAITSREMDGIVSRFDSGNGMIDINEVIGKT